MGKQKTVVIIATLDTKGAEAAFVRRQIAAQKLATILIDTGLLGEPTTEPDIDRHELAQTAGTSLAALKQLAQTEGKGAAFARLTQGLCAIVQKLYREQRLDGIIGLGGGQGTAIITSAMQVLPVGVPKLMLSTIAGGPFRCGPYVGSKDICLMHSVTDICGLNDISRPIMQNAAHAIAGMVLWQQPQPPSEKAQIAISMLGVTTPCVMRIIQQLNGLGYEVVPFHANGSGGPAMEEMIEAGRFVGVVDLNTREMIDQLHNGLSGAPRRLEVLSRYKIPAVVSVGGTDFILFQSLENAPEKYRYRSHIIHNTQMTIVQPTPQEMRQVARQISQSLNRALGPTLVILPLQGFSDLGGKFLPQEDKITEGSGHQAMCEEFQASLRPEIPLLPIDRHINDPFFADLVADSLVRLIRGVSPRQITGEL